MYKIQTLNKISATGLETLDRDRYEVASDINSPDAILVRSAVMHEMTFSPSLCAVARAGAGVNNIPIEALTKSGVVVFNTPGANANAVKELVVLSLLLSSRPVIAANKWATEIASGGVEPISDKDLAALCEKGKSQFIGCELMGKTLGVIGLGAIGALVSNIALHFGMNVIGFDPFLSVKSALLLDKKVQIAETLDTIYAKSDYITLHVPETPDTKGMIGSASLKIMKDGVRIINIARALLVDNKAMVGAVAAGKVAVHVTDFCSNDFLHNPRIICTPHLGASTPEAEDNCAVMACRELMDYLERGNITNSVNFPKTVTDNPIPAGGTRLCISHKNIPDTISKFTTILGEAKLNIAGMINQARGDTAYNIIDVNGIVDDSIVEKLAACETVTKVRPIYA